MTGFMQEGFFGLREKIDQLSLFSKPQPGSMPNHTPEVGRKKLMDWIDAIDTDEDYDQAVSARLSGTCDWIIKRPEFQIWTNLDPAFDFSKTFWIHGAPGFGKSVLFARLVEYLSMQKGVPVAHFFCIGGDDAKRQPRAIIRSWVAQLVNQNPVAVEEVRDFYYGKESRRATESDVWTLFKKISLKIGTCFFAIDGYDECVKPDLTNKNSLNDRSIFLRKLLTDAKDLKIRLLLVSRPEPDIRTQLNFVSSDANPEAFLEYEITPQDTQADISAFSSNMVEQELPNKLPALKNEIALEAVKKCEGMFLWVKLVHARLSPGKNAKQLREVVKVTPPGLDQAYERDLQKIDELEAEDKERAIEILRWLLFAERPLTVRELTEALLIDENDVYKTFPADDLPDAWDDYYVNEQIRRLCGSLVELRRSDPHEPITAHTVHLVHFSVKEYLMKGTGINVTQVQGRKVNFSSVFLEHSRIAQKCLIYLCYEDFKLKWHPTEVEVESKIKQFAFLSYAARSWHYHAGLVGDKPKELLKLMFSLFEPATSRWMLWSRVSGLETGFFTSFYGHDYPGPQYYAAKLGLSQVLEFLRLKGIDLNMKFNGSTLLQVASISGRVATVKYLLDHGADVHPEEGEFGSAIVAAAASPVFDSAEAIIGLLIERGAHVESRDGSGKTPLHFAARSGTVGVIRLLLNAKANIDSKSNLGQTPLHLASINMKLDAVTFLLMRGSGVNEADKEGWTALHNAAYNGHVLVVETLLQKDALVDAQAESGSTALHVAAKDGHTKVIELLLRHGANIQSISSVGSALHFAVYGGYGSAVRSLLTHGINPALRDPLGATALHVAAESPESITETVEMLLEYGADLNAVTQEGETALHLAIRQKSEEAVKILLEHNADCDITPKDGWKALLAAVATGEVNIVRLLLDHGIDVNAVNEVGWTPLMFVADRGYVKIMEMLLEAGADLHLRTSINQTPLHKALYHGSKPAIKMLLSHGADPLVMDVFGQSCMDWASSNPSLFQLMLPYCKNYQPTEPAVRLEFLRKSILSAIEDLLEATHETVRRHWISHIGRCLLLMGEVNEACLAFEGTIVLSPQGQRPLHYATCGTCNTEDFIAGDRYICYSCAEVDACTFCMTKHKRETFISTCKGHEFLKIPREGWEMPEGETEAKVDDFWLDRLMNKYGI